MHTRVVRLQEADEVSALAAQRLLSRLVALQHSRGVAHLCLTGGNTANEMYERLAELADGSELDPGKLDLWWGDERFVPSTDADRNSLQAVSRLARTIPIQAADTHMMPAKDGRKDPHECAAEYEAELGDTAFDILLLGIGEDGHVGSIFPGHPSFDLSSRDVIGVTDAPKAPAERITLTIQAMNRAAEVWFLATGRGKSDAVARAFAGDLSLPAAHVHGTERTLWFLDADAAESLPAQYRCSF